MGSPLDALRRFAGTRQGRLTLGAGAAGGVGLLAYVRRRRAGSADPTGVAGAPPYAVAPTQAGTTNQGAFPTVNAPGIDVGQFEQLLADLGRLADNADQQAMAPGTAPTSPQERSAPPPTATDEYRRAQGMPAPTPNVPYLVVAGYGSAHDPAKGTTDVIYAPTAPRGSWQPGSVWDPVGQQWRPPGWTP